MERYQDYVIKDGRFVGKFEEMYQKFDDPWHQSNIVDVGGGFSRLATIVNIKKFGIKSVVEFGCGFGYYANFISQYTKARVKGIDISSTAIEKARSLYPSIEFGVDKIQNIETYTEYESVLFAEITWYILDDINMIFEKMLKHFSGKYFLHNLVFYKGQQKYGTEYFTNLKEFIDYVPFKLVGYAEATTVDSDTTETSTIFEITKK